MTSPTSLNTFLIRWFQLISSSRWEAVIMFVIYLATRWFSYLRSTAIFLQVYVLAVISREAIVNFGCVFVRLWWWSRLAKNGRIVLPWSVVHTSASELTGFFLAAVLIPLFPFYFLAIVSFVLYTLYVTRSSNRARARGSLLWKSGYVFYHHILASLIGRDPHSKPPLLARVVSSISNGVAPEERPSELMDQPTTDNGIHSRSPSSELFFNATSTPLRANSIAVRAKQLSKQRFRWFLFLALVVLKMLSVYLFMTRFGSIRKLAHTALRTGGTIFGILVGSVLFVAFGGGHSAIVLCIALEVVMAIRGIELETARQELELWIAFVIPVIIQANAHVFNVIIECSLCVLRDELGPEHRLTKISRVFGAIPVNGEETAVKLNDCMKGNGNRSADRIVSGILMSLNEVGEFELRVSLFDNDARHISAEPSYSGDIL